MPDSEKQKTYERWAVILGMLGILLFFFGVNIGFKLGISFFPKTVCIGLLLLFAGMIPFSRFGMRVTFLRIATVLIAAAVAVLLFGNVNIDQFGPWAILAAIAVKSTYMYLYVALMEKVASAYASDKEVSLHIMNNFCITTELMSVILPLMLESYSVISATIMVVLLSTMNMVLVVSIATELRKLSRFIRTCSISAEA